jgi:hypothetical protein
MLLNKHNKRIVSYNCHCGKLSRELTPESYQGASAGWRLADITQKLKTIQVTQKSGMVTGVGDFCKRYELEESMSYILKHSILTPAFRGSNRGFLCNRG